MLTRRSSLPGSNQFSEEFYVSDQDRSGAIRVYLGPNPLVVSNGDMVDVSGIIKGTDLDRYIDYPLVATRFPHAMLLSPYFMANRWLGGQGTDMLKPGGAGPLNTEMLLKVSGRVTYVDTESPAQFFYIDDGSGLSEGQVFDGTVMRGNSGVPYRPCRFEYDPPAGPGPIRDGYRHLRYLRRVEQDVSPDQTEEPGGYLRDCAMAGLNREWRGRDSATSGLFRETRDSTAEEGNQMKTAIGYCTGISAGETAVIPW